MKAAERLSEAPKLAVMAGTKGRRPTKFARAKVRREAANRGAAAVDPSLVASTSSLQVNSPSKATTLGGTTREKAIVALVRPTTASNCKAVTVAAATRRFGRRVKHSRGDSSMVVG